MPGYSPVNIKAFETGLVQSREEFILPEDAYPILENAFVWRERIKRKQGYILLGRLQRNLTVANQIFSAADPATFSGNLFTLASVPETNPQIRPGSVSMQTISVGMNTYLIADQNLDGDLLAIAGSSIGYYGSITGVTTGSTTTITFASSNALKTGNTVYISGIASPGPTQLNGQYWTVISSTAGNFVINADTTGAQAWTSGGIVQYVFGTINYISGAISLSANGAFSNSAITNIKFGYFPGLPVMGIRTIDNYNINQQGTVFFDTRYAYNYDQITMQFEEFIPGTTWRGTDTNFFWTTNYWTDPGTESNHLKLFWATNFNFNGLSGPDPIRYTDTVTWTDFAPQLDQTGTNFLLQCLCILPFRGRLLTFNTIEGPSDFSSYTPYTNRIRWSQVGNPLIPYSPAAPPIPVQGSWLDDVTGKGGFLDIPTNEDIVSVGFVRDNLVIFCERSTWQLRYTGRSIAPFQIEKVNSELGAASTFSTIQFDTSLSAIGEVGIIDCDSYSSERIDFKIPNLVFQFNDTDTIRVHGVRDFVQKVAYWIYPLNQNNGIYPDRRLVYNYENKSWAIFTDSLTALGTFQSTSDPTWENLDLTWQEANFAWIGSPKLIPEVVGGNQQGYIEKIGGSTEGGQTGNDQSLYITNIQGFGILPTSNPVQVTSPNHNLQTGQIIEIINLSAIDPFYIYLNNGIFLITMIDANNFYLTIYNPLTGQYNTPALAPSGTYLGFGEIQIRDNFRIVSKKFNFMDLGQRIQMGFLDILMDDTANGAISMNIYTDYNSTPSNTYPMNDNQNQADTFFNSVIPTNPAGIGISGGTKNWQRVFCPTNANFLTIEYTLNNEQMQNQCQQSDVQIDAQILYIRPGGRQGITQ